MASKRCSSSQRVILRPSLFRVQRARRAQPRVLGAADAVQKATSDVHVELTCQQSAGAILKFEPKTIADWQAADDYGGTPLDLPSSELLASSARLAQELLKEPRRDFAARNAVVQNWAHCVRVVASGMG